jgi:capsular polysaccharide transport system permease protein
MSGIAPPRESRNRFRSLRTILALVLREMTTTYGRSAFGYLWAVLEPIAGIALLSIIFSFALRSPSLGTNFPIFYASGYLIFQTNNAVGNRVAASVRFSRQLLEYPAVTYLDAVFARFILNALTQILVFYIVVSGIVWIYDLKLILDFSAMALALAMILAFSLGVGTLNCYLFVAFPSYEQVWAILTRPLFIISGIFFIYEDLPSSFRDILWYNPIFQAISEMRAGIYATYEANFVSPAYVFGVSALCFALGLMLLRKYLKDSLNV